jgi:hypothetical protein
MKFGLRQPHHTVDGYLWGHPQCPPSQSSPELADAHAFFHVLSATACTATNTPDGDLFSLPNDAGPRCTGELTDPNAPVHLRARSYSPAPGIFTRRSRRGHAQL